jgi:DNA-binding cell septation regulator SpoVG
MSTTVEVVAIHPLSTGSNLRAFASVRIGDIVIHDCRIVQQPNQRPWVSLPQREYLSDGQKKYVPVVEVSDALKRQIRMLVLAEWERTVQSEHEPF